MQQYSKALNGVQKLLASKDAPLDPIVICSLLYIHFEAVRESFAPSLLHMEKVINVVPSNSGSVDNELDPSLVRALKRIDLQGSIWLNGRAPGMSYTSVGDEDLPTSLQSLTQAYDLVTSWASRLFRFLRTSSDCCGPSG